MEVGNSSFYLASQLGGALRRAMCIAFHYHPCLFSRHGGIRCCFKVNYKRDWQVWYALSVIVQGSRLIEEADYQWGNYTLYNKYKLKLVHNNINVYFATIFKFTFISLCTVTYYLGWMSCLISFECCQSSCEEHGTSENYKNNRVHSRIWTLTRTISS